MNSTFLFRRLTPEDVARYQRQAMEQYAPGTEVNPLWHPVYRLTCEQMNVDAVQGVGHIVTVIMPVQP